MMLNQQSFVDKLYQYIQAREYQNALLHCEKELESNSEEFVLIEYINLLLRAGYLDEAYNVLKRRSKSPHQSLNIYHLYQDYYILSGKVQELNKLKNTFNDNPGQQHKEIEPDTDRDASFRQYIDLLKLELKFWSNANEVDSAKLKKSYNLISQGLLEEGNQILNTIATSTENWLLSGYIKAEIALLNGNYTVATELFNIISRDYPRPVVVFTRLGDIAYRLSKYKDARKYYVRSLNYDSSSVTTWMKLIDCYRRLDRLDLAKRYIRALENKGTIPIESVKMIKKMLISKLPTQVSRIYGLSYQEGGGSLLPIEITIIDEKKCLLSGNCSLMLFDSAQIAYQSVKAYLDNKHYALQTEGVQINLPHSVIYKDGPSAGLAFAIGVLSVLMNRYIPDNYAFTGEIDLSGNIHPVGGIRNKVLAARYNGITNVWLPSLNYKDTQTIPKEVINSIKLCFVSNIKEVYNNLWN